MRKGANNGFKGVSQRMEKKLQLFESMRSGAKGATIAVCALIGNTVFAADLAQPAGDPVLTVSGAISVTNVGETAQYDLDMLRAMDPQTIETSTIWTEGVQSFTGVPLASLLGSLGVEGGTIRATAINDYAVEFPFDEISDGAAIVAFENNGEEMSIRDKGPLWIVFPYDSSPFYRTEVVYSRSIWQMDRLEVIE